MSLKNTNIYVFSSTLHKNGFKLTLFIFLSGKFPEISYLSATIDNKYFSVSVDFIRQISFDWPKKSISHICLFSNGLQSTWLTVELLILIQLDGVFVFLSITFTK